MGYYDKKAKHAYECYISNTARKKVYAVVEKEDKFVVLKITRNQQVEYCLAGGSIEEGEDVITAIQREILEELNIQADFVKMLGGFVCQSKWTYKGKEFLVNDDIQVAYLRFVKYGNNQSFGVQGEFGKNDSIAEITKDQMLQSVVEFTKFGIKL